MLFKTQFIKCTLCIILYIAICSVLLVIKRSFYLQQQSNSIRLTKDNQTKQKCSVVSRATTRPTNLEIKLLKHDEVNGQSIDLHESATLLRQISNTCAKYNLKTLLIKRHFLYDSTHKSMYCWIRKVASTSFTKLFSDMKNRRVARNYYREVDVLAPKTMEELYRIANDAKTFKLLVVRHPFQRLVSSYRDRLEDNSKHTTQAWIYTKKIFRLTRPQLFHSNTTTANFQRKVFTAGKRLKIVPTFKEFTLWLLENSEEDVHWDRYYTHCGVCNMQYNYVLKLDDYTYREINYIFSKFGLNETTIYLPKLEKTHGGHTDFDTTCKYLANLTQNMIFKLYEKYKIDFEMYNYNLNRYIFCASKKT
ncbi:carbohydrate sulfotransferase 11-like [Hylaeus anthracinus]|uniref:carbohydrate sulfotransferase 11-like n=1 Tax=Hylaeus anthracinus TaxID=313031 RepID=UPI0023B98EBD|nr:carbohydrate sulfotransferase 11-like [Hylaeus anthracinus]